jgi:hypothetical protein
VLTKAGTQMQQSKTVWTLTISSFFSTGGSGTVEKAVQLAERVPVNTLPVRAVKSKTTLSTLLISNFKSLTYDMHNVKH